jgi:hypothetical protein
MKLYVAFTGAPDCSDHCIEGIFSTEAKAQKCLDDIRCSVYDYDDIEEFDLDSVVFPKKKENTKKLRKIYEDGKERKMMEEEGRK